MTNYIKYTETLQRLSVAYAGCPEYKAISAALDLLRAAEPKDADAEREHCDSVDMRMRPMEFADQRVRVIRAERAAARAEGYALGREDGYRDGRRDYTADLEERDELAAAQAEIERLGAENTRLAIERDTHMEAQQSRLADVHTAGVQSLQKQVAEQQAEIERLRAERAQALYEDGGETAGRAAWRAAIEASK